MPKKAKKAAVPVQSAGPGMIFSKESFFVPSRGPNGGKVAAPVVPVAPTSQTNGGRFAQFEPQRRYVYDKTTGEAYAEWINGVAVCIHTGQELFRSRGYQRDEISFCAGEGGKVEPFDYSVPKQRHPNDYSISTDDMIASGFLTLDAFKLPNGAAVRLVDYESYLKRKKEDGDSGSCCGV